MLLKDNIQRLAIKYSLSYYKQHYTIHYPYQSFLPIILSFKGSCKHTQRIVDRSNKHPHKSVSSSSRGKLCPIDPSPGKTISEDTVTTHFHWKKQQHGHTVISLLRRRSLDSSRNPEERLRRRLHCDGRSLAPGSLARQQQ